MKYPESGYWLDMIKSGTSSAAETVSGQMQTPFTEPIEAAGHSVGFRGGRSQDSDLSSALAHSGASARPPSATRLLVTLCKPGRGCGEDCRAF